MTCQRCDGTGWTARTRWTDTPGMGDRLVSYVEPCHCHGWRPIEEAPRDTLVLVCGSDGNGWDCDVAARQYTGWLSNNDEPLLYDPTHWQPLPDPPEVTT